MLDESVCRCGHDHLTHRGEEVQRCLECLCSCLDPAAVCDNCKEQFDPGAGYDGGNVACSRACFLQAEYAQGVTA